MSGSIAYGQYMMKNLRYPLQAQQAAIMGTSLVSFILTLTGKITGVAVVNPLGEAVDGDVIRVIHQTRKLWLPADNTESQGSVMLFLPITFHLNDSKFYVDPVKPDFLLNEMIVVGYNPLVRMGLKDDDYYLTELSTSFQKKEYKRAVRAVDELIRRNPYSDKLYLQRARIEQELGLTEEACSDYKKIIYLLGRTSFPKKFLKNYAEFPAQGNTKSAQVPGATPIEEIFTVVEDPPTFPGSPVELNDFIQRQLRYPLIAVKKHVEGKVYVDLMVTKEGIIQQVHPTRDVGFGADEEAVRLVQSMPNWHPGKQAGRPVNVKCTLVIPFSLSDLH